MNHLTPANGWKRSLYFASRSRRFLWIAAIAALLAGVAIGCLGSVIRPSEPAKLGERILARASGVQDKNVANQFEDEPTLAFRDLAPAFEREVSQKDVSFFDVLRAIPTLAPHVAPAEQEPIRAVLQKRFSPAEAGLAADFLAAWKPADDHALDRLKARADHPDAPRFANYVVGCVEMKRQDYPAAYARFHKEGERDPAIESRDLAVQALVAGDDFATLTALKKDPRYQRSFPPAVSLKTAIGSRDWRGILKWLPLTELDSFQTGIVIVALIAGLAWAFVLVQLGEAPGLFSTPSLLCLVALACGALSTLPTGYLVILEEDFLHFTGGADFYHVIAYNVGGVGVREELCKLLLFLPLLPFLLKRGDEFEALIVASFVGLGFAIEENCGYFAMSEAASAPGRFLSANFFHVALTGVNGLAVFRLCTRGVAGLNEFLFAFPLTILAHGAYDALFELPGVEGGDYFAMAVYVAFSAYYFGLVRQLRNAVRTTISLTGAFVGGIAVVAGSAIAYAIIVLGPIAGLTAVFPALLGNAILLFMFFREFDEPLSA